MSEDDVAGPPQLPDQELMLRPATRRRRSVEPEPEPDDGTAVDSAPSIADRIQALAAEIEPLDEGEDVDVAPLPATSEPEVPSSPAPDGFVVPAPEVAAVPAVDVAPAAALDEVPHEGSAQAPDEGPVPVPEVVAVPTIDEMPPPRPDAEPEIVAVKKTPAKKAATSTAPAKKAAVSTVPAKKAPATKAAPTKAAATKAAGAKAIPAKKAPAKKAAAKQIPEKKAAAKAPATKGAPRRALVKRAVPPVTPPEVVDVVVAAAALDVVPGLRRERAAKPTPAERRPRWAGVTVVLTVLLLAAAAGLGAAALVESGVETWSSTAVVRLQPGEAPTIDPTVAVKQGQARYVARVAVTTPVVAEAARVPYGDVRGDLRASALGDDQILLEARAADGAEAERLAAAAADAEVAAVAADQERTTTHPGDRLTAVVSRSATAAEHTSPSHSRAALAGGLAGGAVLLLALLWVAFRRGREPREVS